MLLDEPFSGLDPVDKQQIIYEFLSLKKAIGTTVVLVTHDVREALAVCDRIAYLSLGEKKITFTADNPFCGKSSARETVDIVAFRELESTFANCYREKGRA